VKKCLACLVGVCLPCFGCHTRTCEEHLFIYKGKFGKYTGIHFLCPKCLGRRKGVSLYDWEIHLKGMRR